MIYHIVMTLYIWHKFPEEQKAMFLQGGTTSKKAEDDIIAR